MLLPHGTTEAKPCCLRTAGESMVETVRCSNNHGFVVVIVVVDGDISLFLVVDKIEASQPRCSGVEFCCGHGFVER